MPKTPAVSALKTIAKTAAVPVAAPSATAVSHARVNSVENGSTVTLTLDSNIKFAAFRSDDRADVQVTWSGKTVTFTNPSGRELQGRMRIET